MSNEKANQTTDAAQGGEGTRAGNFDNPGLYPESISIGSRTQQVNEAEKPLDDGTK